MFGAEMRGDAGVRAAQAAAMEKCVDPRHVSGLAAERLAADYLETQGLNIIERNFRCRGGELDLVCVGAAVLIVVEVRQRNRADFGGALASVTRAKRRRIMRTAEFFRLRAPQWRRHAVRFDLIAVEGSPDGAYELLWIKDAFRP
jgi:putative endonuclease